MKFKMKFFGSHFNGVFIILFLSVILQFNLQAFGQTPRVFVDTTAAQIGDTVIVSLYVQDVPDVHSFTFWIHYKESALDFVGYSAINFNLGTIANTVSNGNISLGWFGLNPLPDLGKIPLLQYKFVYLSDSTILNFDLAYSELGDGLGNPIVVSFFPGYVLQCPVFSLNSPTNSSVVIGDTAVFSATQAGITNLSYQWAESTNNGSTWIDLVNSPPYAGVTTANLKIFPVNPGLTQRLYRCKINTPCVYYTFPAQLTVLSPSIIGAVTYGNAASTPIPYCTVALKQGSLIVAQTTTNMLGNYSFNDFELGTYTIEANVNTAWGGGNSNDALMIVKHFAGLITLLDPYKTAADVNLDNSINSADALMVLKRKIGLLSGFPSGDWLVSKPNVTFASASQALVDIEVLCFGDVNGSFVP